MIRFLLEVGGVPDGLRQEMQSDAVHAPRHLEMRRSFEARGVRWPLMRRTFLHLRNRAEACRTHAFNGTASPVGTVLQGLHQYSQIIVSIESGAAVAYNCGNLGNLLYITSGMFWVRSSLGSQNNSMDSAMNVSMRNKGGGTAEPFS